MRPCVRRVGDRFLYFYEHYLSLRRSVVELRTSSDLVSWSAPPAIVLEPSLAWEGPMPAATGNPCLVEGQSGFLLYYSTRPRSSSGIACSSSRVTSAWAEGDSPEGPFRKRAQPILLALARQSVSQPRCRRDGGLTATATASVGPSRTGCTRRDAPGTITGSAILLLASADGFAWTQVRPEPIIRPEGRGWKRAFVYQLDVARSGRELRLYYNARSGWFLGAKRIGVAIAST